MAQPVFDGHPLEQYFERVSLTHQPIPGALVLPSPPPRSPPVLMQKAAQLLESLGSPRRSTAFAERFKYGVISSSLLAPALPATPSAADTDPLSLAMPPDPESPVWPLTLSLTVVVAALGVRFYLLASLLLLATLYYRHVHKPDLDVMTPSLTALQHLITAGQLWDTVINDAFTILENEERMLYGPMPSSSLRLALSSTLLTTQTQCDNVRQLLSAITCPSELAQLAEMYAPPSPIKPNFTPHPAHRPLSHPGSSSRPTPATDRTRKRSTWNGSYASLAGLAGTPSRSFELAQRRRSDHNTATSPTPASRRPHSALSSPPQLLADVSEGEEDVMVTAESSLVDEEEHSFGVSVLGMRRMHVQGGLRALELSSHRTLPMTQRTPTTMSPGSKYTRMQAKTRQPFSLSSLRQSLQAALASKRFACSHLLALRFDEIGQGHDGDGDGYWEDARAVMELLTSTFADAAERLAEVLEEVEEKETRLLGLDNEIHTPAPPPRVLAPHQPLQATTTPSYAPMPSHLARFAAHVDAISTALDDAREQLSQCVTSLKDEQEGALMMPPSHSSSPGHSSHPSTSSSGSAAVGAAPTTSAITHGDPADHPAIQAYERLRRELGLALRECERGRERLMNLVVPPTPSTEEEVLIAETQLHEGEVKPDDEEGVSLTVVSPSGHATVLEPEGLGLSGIHDDGAHDHHEPATDLDLPGIEQVFEADSGNVGGFNRERSRLSREERIRAVKARREARARGDPFLDPEPDPGSGLSSSPPSPPTRERWGPSGEVVQELKDVIWKVSERRRKIQTTTTTTVTSVTNEVPSDP